jgi:hypothetical protein
MLAYQKSSAAAPKPRNLNSAKNFVPSVLSAGASYKLTAFLSAAALFLYQHFKSNFCQPQSVGGSNGQVTISGTPA